MSSPTLASSSTFTSGSPDRSDAESNEKETAKSMDNVVEIFPDDSDSRRSSVRDLPDAEHEGTQEQQQEQEKPPMSRKWKVMAVLLSSCVAFGSTWNRGTSSAMKSALKYELYINNTQFALLEASEDFMITLLILPGGLIVDRLGGPRSALAGNTLYSIGGLLVAAAAQTRSFGFMVGGRVLQAIGEIASQLAQYKILAAWFPPSHSFATMLSLEMSMARLGMFIGKATANPIAQASGDIAWVFWVAFFMNLSANAATLAFYHFNAAALVRFGMATDPATGETLTHKDTRFEPRKVLELPWVYWSIMAFSFFLSSTGTVFTQNATEMAQDRFKTNAIAAGWYAATLQVGGIFLGPLIGVFIDRYGNRLSLMTLCGLGVFASMAAANWVPGPAGISSAFGLFGIAAAFGGTVITDSIRTSMLHQSVFGSAMAIKMQVDNSMQIIARITTAKVQDEDQNSYRKVTTVYVIFAGGALFVAGLMFIFARCSLDLRHLQWTRKQRRARGEVWNERRRHCNEESSRLRQLISRICFGGMVVLTLGGWATFFWGVTSGRTPL